MDNNNNNRDPFSSLGSSQLQSQSRMLQMSPLQEDISLGGNNSMGLSVNQNNHQMNSDLAPITLLSSMPNFANIQVGQERPLSNEVQLPNLQSQNMNRLFGFSSDNLLSFVPSTILSHMPTGSQGMSGNNNLENTLEVGDVFSESMNDDVMNGTNGIVSHSLGQHSLNVHVDQHIPTHDFSNNSINNSLSVNVNHNNDLLSQLSPQMVQNSIPSEVPIPLEQPLEPTEDSIIINMTTSDSSADGIRVLSDNIGVWITHNKRIQVVLQAGQLLFNSEDIFKDLLDDYGTNKSSNPLKRLRMSIV
ncbi:hypothetical protein WA158_008519 [Blastocystis sp. Blastoise]